VSKQKGPPGRGRIAFMDGTAEKLPKDVAILCGYNAEGAVVYSVSLDRSDYWDGEHLWDSYDQIRMLGMTKLVGKLYDSDGMLSEQFESAYSPVSGELIGGKATYADGTSQAFGVFAENPP